MSSVTTSRRQGVNSSAAVKVPCRVASTADLTLSGEQTIDGVAVVTDDRVLVKDQDDATENGIYTADTGEWVRERDFDGALDVKKGTLTYVHSGTIGRGFWVVTSVDTVTPGTSSIAFEHTNDGVELTNGPVDAVLDYDADNTGATNTATALNTAIAAAAAEGRSLFLPPGTYLIDATPITVPSDSHIYGVNQWTTKIKRTTNTNDAMVEMVGVENVRIEGIQCEYTNASGTTGYAQAGFQVRNGSIKIDIDNCAVVGEVNRGIHIINAAAVRVTNCTCVGTSNSGIRVVSDHAANLVAGMSDEDDPIPVHDILIQGCRVYGGATIGAGVAVSTYGINIGAESGASDLVSACKVIGCHVEYCTDQGFAYGGKVQTVSITDCTALNITGASGVGFLVQRYSTTSPSRVKISGCDAQNCTYGFYVDKCSIVILTACIASNNDSHGFYFNGHATDGGSIYTAVACQSIANGDSGFVVATVVRAIIEGCHSIGNDVGISTDAAADRTLLEGNIVLDNTSTEIDDNGTNEILADNIVT